MRDGLLSGVRMNRQDCAVCNGPNAKVRPAGDSYKVNCAYCGDYVITGSAHATLAANALINPRQIANARSWIRENQGVLIRSADLEMLRALQSPNVAKRAEKMLLALNKSELRIGEISSFQFDEAKHASWTAISWSINVDELGYLLIEYLAKTKGWLIVRNAGVTSMTLQISPSGYEHIESLRSGNVTSASGFCAMWFSSEVTHIWTDAIKPAINAAGYDAVRVDGVEHNNKIDDEILANIRASRFVIADFTGERGGVYFEAGFAMGLGRPVIWTVRDDQLAKVHFDNRQYNFIVWKPDELEDFAKRLQLRIEATIGRGPVSS